MKYLSAEKAGRSTNFLMIPRQIADDPRLTLEAKWLYTVLFNRAPLSAQNKRWDEKGVYVYCTTNDAARILGRGRDKTLDTFRVLERHNLIYRPPNPGCKGSRIYLADPDSLTEVTDSPTETVGNSDWNGRENRPQTDGYTDPNQIYNQTYISQTENQTPLFPSPVLSQSDAMRRLKVKLDMGYLSRLGAGESEEALKRELEARLKSQAL